MARSLAVLAFIGLVAAAAIFVSRRPTVARGEVFAADLMATNHATLRSLDCDPEIPVGIDGARFWCKATYTQGSVKRLEFKMDRTGGIKQIGEAEVEDGAPSPSGGSPPPPPIDKTDPWN